MKIQQVLTGDCIEQIKQLPDNSIDAIVTDPPYELGFMGKQWDSSGITYNTELWKECLRVLKPGAHLISFCGTRTYHRMTVAIEDSGFEVRDMMNWVYNSGFPKSLNIGKAADKVLGNEREVVGKGNPMSSLGTMHDDKWESNKDYMITKGNSPYEGIGTALKPAHEPIVLARKPLSEKTILANIMKHGTGGLDIDGCRIPTSEIIKEQKIKGTNGGEAYYSTYNLDGNYNPNQEGRFPANILCTDDALNDGEITKSSDNGGIVYRRTESNSVNKKGMNTVGKSMGERKGFVDPGSKSRFFDIDVWGEKNGIIQIPKASQRERNAGCENIEGEVRFASVSGVSGQMMPTKSNESHKIKGNCHPTVKPVHLMAWLIRLVTKPGDTVLDPFAGSGTTAVACIKQNRNFIMIERQPEYIQIINSRIQYHIKQSNSQNPTLFDKTETE